MPKIHVLLPHLANQIAAGEVVERPASIVKELVENAIDAGATAVSVSLQDGGLSSILVSDNGCGLSPEDAPNAFLRHATSKISTAEDLNAISSLGFRGEALASIGAVASVTMVTRPQGADVGTKVIFDNGCLISQQETACVFGTSLRVENLFAKVPARLKFLKSPRTEAGYCGDYMARMLLCRPDIAFRFMHNEKLIYETFGDGEMKNAVFALYGTAVAEKLCRVDFDNGYMKLEGYIGNQEISRPNRTMESLFVNGRYIRSIPLSAAIERAYDTRMMVGRYPFAALHLTLSPRDVDVNVHPAKTQVRFADEGRVAYGVTSACAQALREKVIPRMQLPLEPVKSKQNTDRPTIPVKATEFAKDALVKAKPLAATSAVMTDSAFQEKPDDILLQKYGIVVPQNKELRENTASSFSYNSFTPRTKIQEESAELPSFQVSPHQSVSVHDVSDGKIEKKETKPVQETLSMDMAYQIVGCAFSSYWIVEQGEDLYLIDQHAACERRLYEEFSARATNVGSQELLVPQRVVLQPREYEQAMEYKKELEELGYRFEKVETLSLEITAVPILNGMVFDGEFLHDALNAIGEAGRGAARSLVRDKIISASCKHAIKAGERIDRKEIEVLLKLYLQDETPLTCPHGRPVMIKLSRREIEKGFKRIV